MKFSLGKTLLKWKFTIYAVARKRKQVLIFMLNKTKYSTVARKHTHLKT